MTRLYTNNSRPMEQRGPIQPMSKDDAYFWDWRHGRSGKPGFKWFKNWRERRAGRV